MRQLVLFVLLLATENCFAQFPVDTIRIDTLYWETKAIKEVTYYSDLFNYSFIRFYSNGKIHFEGNYNGHLSNIEIANLWDTAGQQKISNGEGTYIDYYLNGNLKEKGQVHYGKRGDIWIAYYSNGKKNSEGSYSDQNGYFTDRRQGEWKFWYPSGQIARISKYSNNFEDRILEAWDKKGKKTLNKGFGMITEYFESGQVKATGQVRHGGKWGIWKEYFLNGKTAVQIMYTYTWNDYSKDSIMRYNLITAWDTNGQITFSDGNGFKKDYNDNNILESYWVFKNNKMDSIFLDYYPNGMIRYKDIYENGILINRTWYHINGTIASTSGQQGKGSHQEWYTNGILKSETVFLTDSTYTTTGYAKNGDKLFVSNCVINMRTADCNTDYLKKEDENLPVKNEH